MSARSERVMSGEDHERRQRPALRSYFQGSATLGQNGVLRLV